MKEFTIMIVEDEVLIAKSLKLDLESFGYMVLAPVLRGKEAISVALEKKPSLLLMDVQLGSDVDGIDAAEKILESSYNIPIVFITGYNDDISQERMQAMKPVAIFDKPVDIQSLKRIIEELKSS